MKIKIKVEINTPIKNDGDEVWHGTVKISGCTFSWYANTDIILIDGHVHQWPESIGSVNAAVASCTISQYASYLG